MIIIHVYNYVYNSYYNNYTNKLLYELEVIGVGTSSKDLTSYRYPLPPPFLSSILTYSFYLSYAYGSMFEFCTSDKLMYVIWRANS